MDQAAAAHQAPKSQSRQDGAQDSLAPGGDNQVVRENAEWSRSSRAQGSLLMLAVCDERERERQIHIQVN